MKFAVIVLMVLSMSGCGENSKIQEAVLVSLKDPDSAKFGKLTLLNEKRACMTVNAKNTLGGYTGDQEAYLQKFQNKWEVIMFDSSLGHEQCIKIQSKYN